MPAMIFREGYESFEETVIPDQGVIEIDQTNLHFQLDLNHFYFTCIDHQSLMEDPQH